MYENECACSEKSNAMEMRKPVSEMQVSAKALDLLTLLNEIERMTERINGVLFGGLDGEKKCEPCPSCLSENIDMATDVARVIAKNLDKIIQKL